METAKISYAPGVAGKITRVEISPAGYAPALSVDQLRRFSGVPEYPQYEWPIATIDGFEIFARKN